MKYTSTRDPTKHFTFEEALFSGYAPDGGLYVPTDLPDLKLRDENGGPSEVLTKVWPKLGYRDLATEILHPFLGSDGIPKEDLRSLLERTLEGFDYRDEGCEDPVPIVPMIRKKESNDDENSFVDCYVAELFHGPTNCFKDLGMRATVFLLEYFASSRNAATTTTTTSTPKKVVLTAATTGDTGPAAVKAVRDLDSPYLGIVVHYPEGQISDFQRKQMTTIFSDRVEVVSFEGGGDDMDRPIKNIMTMKDQDTDTSDDADENILVCGVNSYNIGRPLMQMVHFVWTYLRVVDHIEKETDRKVDQEKFRLDVVIPTGAMGNMAACYMAKKLGVPFGNLCAGVNVNDITHRAFSTGQVRRPLPEEPMKTSLSDAINIQLPYNLERLLFYLTDQNHTQVRDWYEGLEGSGNGSIDLTKTSLWLEKLRSEFRSARVTDEELGLTVLRVLETYGYWVDPHTGVAFSAAEQLGYGSLSPPFDDIDANRAVAIMATASPCKFETAMTKMLGPERWKEYELHHFPVRGRDLKHKEEKPPTKYLADPRKSLEENQLLWEANTRELIAKVGRC